MPAPESALSTPTPQVCPSIQAADLDPRAFQEEFVIPAKPVIIHGAMETWPALERWPDPEYLPRVFKDKQLSPAGNAVSGSMAEFCADLLIGGEKAKGYLERPITRNGAPQWNAPEMFGPNPRMVCHQCEGM